jgi:hypothetical protein
MYSGVPGDAPLLKGRPVHARNRYLHGVTASDAQSRWPAPEPLLSEVAIVPLTRGLLDLDLTAYCSSPRAIRAHSAGRWPTENFTREEDCRLIERHEEEHVAGDAYAYAILSADRTREMGCVYLRPLVPFLERTGTRLCAGTVNVDRTAIVTYWVLDDDAARPPTERILDHLRGWLHQWDAADTVFRCLPEEVGSVTALTGAAGLESVPATDQALPYLWFAEPTSARPQEITCL